MKSIFKALRFICELEPWLLPVTVLDLICQNIPMYIDTILGAYVLDSLIIKRNPRQIIWAVLAALLLRLLLKSVGEITTQIVYARSNHMQGMFQVKKSQKIAEMDYAELNSPRINALRDRINRSDMHGWGIWDIYEYFSQFLGGIISMAAALCIIIPMIDFSAGSLIYLSLTAAAVLFVAFLNGRFIKKQQSLEDSYSSSRSHSSYYLWGNSVDYKMGKDIRLYNAQPMIENAIAEDENERQGRRRYIRFSQKAAVFNRGFTSAVQGSSYIYVVLIAIKNAVNVGSVVKMAVSLYSFWNSLSGITTPAAALLHCSKRLEDTLAFMEIPSEEGGKQAVPHSEDWEFEFKNVSFSYPGSEKKALNNISCRLKKRERTAVVGLNGSGKTTFIKLLCRLYRPTEGEILLNGVNINEYSFNSYMKLLSVVFQDFKLFSFTLGENVGAGKDYNPDAVQSVLATAGFGDRFSEMEKGCETVLYKNFDDDGIDLSGGEAQKIALARALYKDSQFMILDEPTAALDPIAEYEIYSRFNSFTKDKGAVYISHRLSSCVFCDRIMVFCDGKIVQQGTHENLLSEDGLYSELWNAQAQYYK